MLADAANGPFPSFVNVLPEVLLLPADGDDEDDEEEEEEGAAEGEGDDA